VSQFSQQAHHFLSQALEDSSRGNALTSDFIYVNEVGSVFDSISLNLPQLKKKKKKNQNIAVV
jgi:hypothetical protein